MEKKTSEVKKGILPKIAQSIGQRSVDTYCLWWFNQPKVPDSLKRKTSKFNS